MNIFSRFLTVGVLNSVLGYCVIFFSMYVLSLSPELSNALGYGIGLVFSFVMNRNYTFRSNQRVWGELVRFLIVFLVAYAANLFMLVALLRWGAVDQGVGQVLAGFVYVVFSFALNKIFVFKA